MFTVSGDARFHVVGRARLHVVVSAPHATSGDYGLELAQVVALTFQMHLALFFTYCHLNSFLTFFLMMQNRKRKRKANIPKHYTALCLPSLYALVFVFL